MLHPCLLHPCLLQPCFQLTVRQPFCRAEAAAGRCSGSKRTRRIEGRLAALLEHEAELRNHRRVGTGVAFLSFNTVQDAANFVDSHKNESLPLVFNSPVFRAAGDELSNPLRGGGDEGRAGAEEHTAEFKLNEAQLTTAGIERLRLFSWKVHFAPDPKDILWENLHVSPEARRRRRRQSNCIVLLLLLIGSALVLVGVFAIGFHYVNLVYGIEAEASVTGQLEELMVHFGALYWVVFLMPPALFFGMVAAIPVFAKRLLIFECHHERASVMHSYVSKVFAFFLLLNLVLTSLAWAMIVANSNVPDRIRIWCDLSGTFHICVVLTESFILVPMRFSRGWNLHRGKELIELPLFSLPSPALPFNPTMKKNEVTTQESLLFDFGKQYAELFSIFAMLLAYSPIVPFLVPFGWLYFGET
eukprot:SAG11_NODE_3612_length_2340_cov_2.134315_3_plen_414_part_01